MASTKEQLKFIREMMEKLGIKEIQMKDPNTGKTELQIKGRKKRCPKKT